MVASLQLPQQCTYVLNSRSNTVCLTPLDAHTAFVTRKAGLAGSDETIDFSAVHSAVAQAGRCLPSASRCFIGLCAVLSVYDYRQAFITGVFARHEIHQNTYTCKQQTASGSGGMLIYCERELPQVLLQYLLNATQRH